MHAQFSTSQTIVKRFFDNFLFFLPFLPFRTRNYPPPIQRGYVWSHILTLRCTQHPPFSITGINEWHTKVRVRVFAYISRHSYHRHQRVAPEARAGCSQQGRPPFSITGINEWHPRRISACGRNATAIQYHRHQRVAQHLLRT